MDKPTRDQAAHTLSPSPAKKPYTAPSFRFEPVFLRSRRWPAARYFPLRVPARTAERLPSSLPFSGVPETAGKRGSFPAFFMTAVRPWKSRSGNGCRNLRRIGRRGRARRVPADLARARPPAGAAQSGRLRLREASTALRTRRLAAEPRSFGRTRIRRVPARGYRAQLGGDREPGAADEQCRELHVADRRELPEVPRRV